MADPKIKYDIEAAVKGDADAEKLANELRGLSELLDGDLKTSALGAAQALDTLADKQGTLGTFAQLKRETTDLGASLKQAAAHVDGLAAELPQATARAKEFAAAESTASGKLAETQANLQRSKDALKSLNAETTGAARGTLQYREAVAGLNSSISAATKEVSAQRSSLSEAKQASAEAQRSEEKLRKEYDLAVTSAGNLSTQYRAKTAALADGRAAMQAAGLSTTNLTDQQQQLKLAVEQVRQRVASMAPAYKQAEAAAQQSATMQTRSHREISAGVQSISAQLQRLQNLSLAFTGGGFLGGMIKDVAATADEFKNLEARVKLATGEGAQFETSFAGVQRVALETSSALDETATLFARLTKAAQEGGASAQDAQQRALDLTRTINQSIQLSGGSAESAKAAITQLIQGLQSGVLRGEEFNSVMEQAPRLAQALANGLGVTTGELRKMANQGQLTSETVMKALQGQADAVAAEFSKLPPTVGRALQNLSTQWTQYVGASDKGIISSQNAARFIDLLARNLDTLVETLTTAGKVLAASQIAKMADWFGAWAARTLAATTAIEANSAATVANTVAQRANATAVAATAAAQTGAAAATGAATVAQALNAKSWGELGQALKKTTAGQGDFQRAAASATAAVNASTAASAALASGAAATAGRVGLLGTALRGVTGLLGGPVGLIASMALLWPEFKRFGEWLGESTAKLMGHGKALEALTEQQRQSAEAAKAHAEQQRAMAQRLQETREASFDLTAQSKALIAEFDKATQAGKTAGDAIADIGKKFDPTTFDGIRALSSTLQKLGADGKLSADQVRQAWAQALNGQDLLKFETMARAAFAQAGEAADDLREKYQQAIDAGASPEAIQALKNRLQDAESAARGASERMALVMDNSVRVAVQRTGLDFDALQGKIGDAARSALNDVEIIMRGLDGLKAQGVDTGRALTASLSNAIRSADSEAALEAVRRQIEAVRAALGNTVADGLLDQAALKARQLSDELDRATPGINSLREAFAELGLKGRDELGRTAQRAQEAFDTMMQAGQQEGESYLAWLERKRQAAETLIRRQIEANNGMVSDAIRTQAAVNGVELAVDGVGRATVATADKTHQAANRMADGWSTVAGSIDKANQKLDEHNKKASEASMLADRLSLSEQRKDWSKEGGQTVVMGESQAELNQRVAALFGQQAIGNKDAIDAANLKRKLDQAAKYGTGGLNADYWNALRQEYERLAQKVKGGGNVASAKGGGSAASQPAASAPSGTAKAGGSGISSGAVTYVTNITFDGQRSAIRLADQASYDELQELMTRLANDKRRAA